MKMGTLGVSAAVAVLVAASAMASPRESATFTNVLSNPAPAAGGGATTVTQTMVGGYPVKYLVVNGTMTEIATGTFAFESTIQVIAPGDRMLCIQPSQVVSYTGSTNVVNLVYKVPIDIPDAAGTWSFRFSETYNDGGATDDARWDTVTFTLDDGPPAATDLGVLTQQGRTKVFNQALSSNQIQWYKLIVPSPITVAGGTFLDIDTHGTTLSAGAAGPDDPEIGLYTADGVLVAADDDGGANAQSLLSFGLGGRPSEGSSNAYNGQSGEIAAGVYYLCVSAFNTTFGATGWNATVNAPAATGQVNVRIRTNVGAPNAKNLGTLSQNRLIVPNIPIAAGDIRWFRFDVADDAVGGSGLFVDIDTRGSNLPGSFSNNDTEIGVYTAAGNLVSADDDGYGGTNLSLLSFGQGGRGPLPGGTVPRNGQNGPLPAGAYYIAISAYNTAFGGSQWGVTTTHPRVGLVQLNFGTNTGDPATCPADLDNGSNNGITDGGVTIDDLLYFLFHFEGGC
jgi:hypothetical protein